MFLKNIFLKLCPLTQYPQISKYIIVNIPYIPSLANLTFLLKTIFYNMLNKHNASRSIRWDEHRKFIIMSYYTILNLLCIMSMFDF